MKQRQQLNVAKKAQALIKQNNKLAQTNRRFRDKVALTLGETIGLTGHGQDANVIREEIDLVAPIWMRQCNRLDKRKTDLETIGKKLGIDGTPRDVKNRLTLFKFYHSQYKIMCRVCLTVCQLRLLS